MLILTTFLTSCGTAVKQLDIFTKEVERQPLNLAKPLTPKLEDIKWIIITSENAEEVFAQLLKDRKDPVLIGLTDDGYEILSLNYSDIMAYIQQQNAIIKAYRNYYEESEQALEDANNEINNAQTEVEAQNSAPEESTLDKLNPFK